MRKLFVLLLCVTGLLLVSCGEQTVTTATPTPVNTPIATSKTWHVTQHFSSTEVFLGSSLYSPDRNEQVTVTEPWRITWHAHLDDKGDMGFFIHVCQNEDIGNGMAIPECTLLVDNGSGSGVTAPITKVYNDVDLSMDIGGVNSTWAFNIEELS